MGKQANSNHKKITQDILSHPEFLKLKTLRHHKQDIYHHVYQVSVLSYKLAKTLRLDYKSAARGGLLHDFFIYDWRKDGQIRKKKLFEKHGFTHSKQALKNARMYFTLNKIEEDIIIKHMFPLTPQPPRYAESWLVSLVDKYVTVSEYLVSVFKKRTDPK